jgi:hypothetical protein
MVETIDDTARIRRLTEFATDVAHLADQRLDPDLRRLIDKCGGIDLREYPLVRANHNADYR